jgi:hypothetical protein
VKFGRQIWYVNQALLLDLCFDSTGGVTHHGWQVGPNQPQGWTASLATPLPSAGIVDLRCRLTSAPPVPVPACRDLSGI